MRKKIEKMVAEFYNNNDSAHKLSHAIEVCDNFLEIDKVLKLNLDKKLMILIAYFHDIFANVDDRKIHERKAAMYIFKNRSALFSDLTKKEVRIVYYAVLQHRASYKGAYYSIYSRVMNAADKGKLLIDKTIIRSFKYHFDRSQDENEAIIGVFKHMKDKFGSNGYFKPDDFYLKCYKDSYDLYTKNVDNLTIEYITKIVSSWRR